MKRSLLVLSVLALSTHASADVITMKNGDVYRGEVLKEEFGKYVQIMFKDGNEKRLRWQDIDALERGGGERNRTIAEVPPTPTTQENSPTTQEHYYPSQMLNDVDKFRFELNIIPFSYDSTWQKESTNIPNTNLSGDSSVSNHYLRTAPMEFSLAVYMGRWHAYFDFFNSLTNNNDVPDQSFASFALAYALSRNFDIGIVSDFKYSSTSANDSGNSHGSSYAFGPQLRVVTPVGDDVTFEATLGAGLNFRNLTLNTSTTSLTGSDTAFSGLARIATSVNLYKGLSYVGWIDGWITLGTLDGNLITGGKTYPGTDQLNTYRLRVVPVGLRMKF